MGTTTHASKRIDAVLDDLCARNSPLCLSWTDGHCGAELSTKVRCLRRCENGIIVSEPTRDQENRNVPLNRPITAQFGHKQQFFIFSTLVLNAGERVQLNEQFKLRGLLLQTPDAIEPFQRRSHFRVPIVGKHSTQVQVSRVHPEYDNACPLSGYAGVGKLINLSAGGAAVLLDKRAPWRPQMADTVFLYFDLPESGEQMCMLATVRFRSYLEHNSAYRLGFEFLPWSGQDLDRCRREIMQAGTALERLRLRRGK